MSTLTAEIHNAWENLPENHPQYTIKKLLDGLGVGNDPIPEWPDLFSSSNLTLPCMPRPNFITSIFSKGGAPDGAAVTEAAIGDLTLITSESIYSESQTISLIVKEFLTNHQGDVSLIAEDQRLIKQIALQLRQWNLEVCYYDAHIRDSLGAGTFLQLVAEMICSTVSPVSLLSTLKHPMCKGHTSPTLFKTLLNELIFY